MRHPLHAMRGVRPAAAVAAAALLWLFAPAPVDAQETGVVTGTVTDVEGRPLAGARAEIVDLERGTLADRRGHFRFSDVPAGEHRLRIEALGFAAEERAVRVTPGDEASVELSLATRPFELAGVVATGTPLRGSAPYQPAQAFDRRAVASRIATSFGEMLDGEPGLAMRSFGPVTGRPVIRGLDGDRVAMLENGQRMGDMSETAHDHAIAMEPLTADRVEVVRGPASLLYGSSALGGVVNLLRRDIPVEWAEGLSGTASAQGATVNRLGAAAGSAVYGADRWAATGRASLREGGNFRAPGTPDGVLEGTYGRLMTGGAGIGWRGDAVHGGLAFDLHDHVYGLPEELDDPDENVEIRSERQRLTGQADWRRSGLFENVELRVAGARFFQQEVEMERGSDGSIDEDVEHEFTRFTADASVTAGHGRIGPFQEGAVGASITGLTLAASGEDEFHPDGRTISGAVFAFEEAPLSELLTLQVGARMEHQRTAASENEIFPGFSARRDATTISGSVGLHARPSNAVEIGAQLARAHRAPLHEQLYSDGPHLGAGRYEIGDPELANEIGHGLDFFGRFRGTRVRGEVALFGNWIEDYVFPRPTGETYERSGLPVVRWTAVAAHFVGGEASLESLLTDALSVRATADYVRGTQRGPIDGPLPFMPPARATFGATYDPGDWWVGGRTRLAATQSRTFRDEEPTDGYALLDLQAGLRLGGMRDHLLILRVDNALDTVYRDHLSRVDERRFPMPGRNLNLVYRWSF